MSATLESLQRQIDTGDDLHSIVTTMKALAATSVRQYERAAESLDNYFHTVQMGLSVVLSSRSEIAPMPRIDPNRPVMMIVFGSDHGLVGRFNEQIVRYALEEYWIGSGVPGEEGSPRRIVLAVGEQVMSRVDLRRGEELDGLDMPTAIEGVTATVQTLLERIEATRSREGVERVFFFYNRPVSGGSVPRAEVLLPVNVENLREEGFRWESRSLPTFTMDADVLLSALLRQYFFVSMFRACALSLAAENTNRLMAMQAAEKNIEERLEELRAAHRQGRQAAITGELLDIISGFRAIRDRGEEDAEAQR